VYQRHEFANEKRAALDLWGKHVAAHHEGKAGRMTEETNQRFKRILAAYKDAIGDRDPADVNVTLLHGGFARRVLTSRRLRSCYSSEYRTPELVHPVEGLDGNCNVSRTTGIVA
jgi:hypothetical protein